jgi:hypothetical protein
MLLDDPIKEKFQKAYEKTYDYNETKSYSLKQSYLSFVYSYAVNAYDDLRLANSSPKDTAIFIDAIIDSPRFPSYRFLWLFVSSNIRFDYEKFMTFVISINDSTLQIAEYILFFYISQQNEELRKITDGLPLPMLHDMFEPIALTEFGKWKQIRDEFRAVY